MTPEQRKQLLAPAVYVYLCFGQGLPRLDLDVARAICREWPTDLQMLDRLGVCGYPSRIQNWMIAEECAKRYGDLSTVDGFYKCRGLWFMDLEEKHEGRGYLMPMTCPRFGWVSRILVYRHAKDQHPFVLKVRKEASKAA